METKMKWRVSVLACFALLLGVAVAQADSLHGVCDAPTPVCSDNGTYTLVDSTSPHYGFTVSSGPESGDLLIIALIPDNLSGAKSQSFSVTGGAASPATEFLVKTTAWTSGALDSFLGISASPNNPIGAYLPTTQIFDPLATGYFVYEANLGTNTLLSPSATTATPDLFDGSFVFPEGSVIVGFLNTGSSETPDWIATANSAQLYIDTPVPEPSLATLLLIGCGLLGVAGLYTKRKAEDYPLT
jgi:hypothetical protein